MQRKLSGVGTRIGFGTRSSTVVCAALVVGACWLGTGPATSEEVAGPLRDSAAWRTAEVALERPASALAAAMQAGAEGDHEFAAWLFGATATRHPIIGDYARQLEAEELAALDRPHAAATLLESALREFEGSPLAVDFSAALGFARAAVGNETGARAAWRRALDESEDETLFASLLSATAQSLERSGDASSAVRTWAVIWSRYPISAEAPLAEAALDRLEPTVGVQRDAAAFARRGDRLFRDRRNEDALEAYERALAGGLPESQAESVRNKRAQTLFRMRAYPRAVEAFAALRQTDDVPLWYARSLARADRVPESIEAFEVLAQRRGDIALHAHFLAAQLLDGRDRFDEARAHLESLARRGQGSDLRHAALWRLAWAAYRQARYADAIGEFDRLVAGAPDPVERLRSRYWRARALEKMGSLEASAASTTRAEAAVRNRPVATPAAREATREFSAIAAEYPLSYYGWRARTRLPAAEARDAAGAGAAIARASGGRVGSATLPEIGSLEIPPRELARAKILLEAGLDEAAIDALTRASKHARTLRDRLELAQLFHSAGEFAAAQRLVVDPYNDLLARGPARTLEDLWWHAWPAAFGELVREATRAEGSVDPALVLAIMREESGFRPAVVSPVGARGLLQIMEPTGRRLAEAVGHPNFTADDLFDPSTNVRLGAYYLTELRAQFGGRLSAAIASYNAGPHVVSEWLAKWPDLEDDEWIESIPYDQTRDYVKRVLRSLEAYRLLY